MKVSMSEPNPGVFFPWPGAKSEEDGGITIRALTIEKITEIDKATTTIKRKFRGNAPYEDITVDESQKEEMMWDYCIEGWENLEDENGKQIECTKEMKTILMRTNFKFSVHIGDCLEQLGNFAADQKENESKNSSTS